MSRSASAGGAHAAQTARSRVSLSAYSFASRSRANTPRSAIFTPLLPARLITGKTRTVRPRSSTTCQSVISLRPPCRPLLAIG